MITCSNWLRSALIGQRSRRGRASSLTFSPRSRPSRIERSERTSPSAEHLRPQRLPPREGQKLADQAGGPVGVLLDVHDVLEGRVARPVVGEQEVGEADDRGQHVVEVVRDAAGELADRLHLLALRELLLERALLGDVEGIDDRRLLAFAALLDRVE